MAADASPFMSQPNIRPSEIIAQRRIIIPEVVVILFHRLMTQLIWVAFNIIFLDAYFEPQSAALANSSFPKVEFCFSSPFAYRDVQFRTGSWCPLFIFDHKNPILIIVLKQAH